MAVQTADDRAEPSISRRRMVSALAAAALMPTIGAGGGCVAAGGVAGALLADLLLKDLVIPLLERIIGSISLSGGHPNSSVAVRYQLQQQEDDGAWSDVGEAVSDLLDLDGSGSADRSLPENLVALVVGIVRIVVVYKFQDIIGTSDSFTVTDE